MGGYDTIDWMAYKQENFISHSSRGWEFQDKSLADLVSGEVPVPGSVIAVNFLCFRMAERLRKFSEDSFIRVLIPFTRAPPV